MKPVSDIKEGRRRLSKLLLASRAAVALTGAGMSTESGIPDFRSPGGLWSRMRPIEFDEFLASEEARREDWRRRFDMNERFAEAVPNAGHLTLARWLTEGRLAAILTQNIDGLHQRAGCPDTQLVELHGNATFATCLDCERRYELAWVRGKFETSGDAPRCEACGGWVKAAVISFGQSLPAVALQRAVDLARRCDLFLVAGSSLVVQPAASLPLLAVESGARLVILDRQPTPLDGAAELLLRGNIGEFLGDLA